MDLFSLSFVLRGFPPSTYLKYDSGEKPCAALRIKKISHFWTENLLKIKSALREG